MLALGKTVLNALAREGVFPVAYRWWYDRAIHRRFPFPPHRRLHAQIIPFENYPVPNPGGFPLLLKPGDHKGCVTGDTVVDAASISAVTLRWHEGGIVRLATAGGQELSITPNHPVLTDRGWVAAMLLDEGDNLVTSTDPHAAANLVPHVDHRPARVDDLFAALWRAGEMESGRMPVAPEDFHGDGSNGDVYVVSVDRLLRRRLVGGEPVEHSLLGIVMGLGSDLTGGSPTDETLNGIRAASLGGVRGRGVSLPLLGGEASVSDDLLLAGGSLVDLGGLESPVYDIAAHAESLGQSQDGLAGLVASDKVLDVEFDPSWRGHVFNLSTSLNWYTAQTIIVHNCRCLLSYLLRGPDGRFLRREPTPERVPLGFRT